MTHPTANARLEVAGMLLDAGSVSVRTEEPFRLPSGWASPVYMDCRRLISFPGIRTRLVEMAIQRLTDEGVLEKISSIAGAESSGIALAAWLAGATELPLQFVRKRPVATKHVEGVVVAGSRVLLVDDLMAAGQSKMVFLRALGEAGALVRDLLVVFDYGTFGAEQMLRERGVRLHALATWADVLTVARARNTLDPRALKELDVFLQNPSRWSLEHGGIGATPAFA